MYKKINLSFARLLSRLEDNEEIYGGELQKSSKSLLAIFEKDGILDWKPIGKQQKKYYCRDRQALHGYIRNKFEIQSSLKDYILYLENQETERSDAVSITSDSKFKNEKVLKGFFVNSFHKVHAQLNGKAIELNDTAGACTFINDYKNFILPDNITVSVVENFENFIQVQKQEYLFKSLRPVFLWRFQNSNSIVNWFKANSHAYLHFGDFDLKGIHIYITEFRNKIGAERSSFFIPDKIEELIERGTRKSFDEQYNNLKNFDFTAYPEISKLVELIFKAKRCLHQEILIQNTEK